MTSAFESVVPGDQRLQREEKSDEEDHPVGETHASKEACDKMIDAVERALELEAFEQGHLHSDRGLDRVVVEGDYPMRDVPRWML